MAVDYDSSSIRPLTSFGFNTSYGYPTGSQARKPLVQVATDNSATFIQFPAHYRSKCMFRPIYPSRTSFSSTPVSSINTETPSVSKSSGSDQTDTKRDPSQVRVNPILNNPLLNHRKEQPKTPLTSNQIGSSPRPLKHNIVIDPLSPTNRASTAPIFAHQINPNPRISDRNFLSVDEKIDDSNQQRQYPLLDENKHDYISRWISEVRAATFSHDTLNTRPKRTKRRLMQT